MSARSDRVAVRSLPVSIGVALLFPVALRAGDPPLSSRDKTGLTWTLPFQEALAKAEKDNRLLLIKPVAFGTTADGGW